MDLRELKIQLVLYLLQRNKGVYLDLSFVYVLYLILKLKLSCQNVNKYQPREGQGIIACFLQAGGAAWQELCLHDLAKADPQLS